MVLVINIRICRNASFFYFNTVHVQFSNRVFHGISKFLCSNEVKDNKANVFKHFMLFCINIPKKIHITNIMLFTIGASVFLVTYNYS